MRKKRQGGILDPNSVVREGEFGMRNPKHISGVLGPIMEEYPRLSGYDWQLIEGDPGNNFGGGSLEFFHPQEKFNPIPTKPTIALFDKGSSPEETRRMVYGDMMHYLPEVDPEFSSLRDDYAGSLTDRQKQIDRMAYQRDVRHSLMQNRRPRSFDDFMDVSRLDAHLRGYLAPDRNNEWAGSYTPEQIKTFKSIQELLRQPR